MTNDALTQKRSQLSQAFDRNTNRFLVARALQMTERAIRTITRNPQPLRSAYTSLFVLVFNLAAGLVLALALGETARFQVVGLSWLLAVTVSTLGGLSAYYLGRFVFQYLKEYLLDVQDECDLDDLQAYMQKLWFPAHAYWRVILPIVLWGVFGNSLFGYFVGAFAGVGVVFGTLVFGFNLAIGFDFLIWMIGLPKHIGRYHYILNNVDPSSSEIVFRIAHLFNTVMYAYAAFFMVPTIAVFTTGRVIFVGGIPLVLAFWAILTMQFISNQGALKNIISTAKWNTLNHIQAEIRALQTSGTLVQKETTDAINRLMDLHERVRSTPNSTMNTGTTLNFLNQLFLPILGVMVSYLDLMLKFFHLR